MNKTVIVKSLVTGLTHKWEHDGELYCPCCDERQVWVERSYPDYYMGFKHLCAACGEAFHFGVYDYNTDREALEVIRRKP